MFNKSTTTLLEKKLKSLPHIVMERELRHDIDDLVADILPPQKLAIIDDTETSSAFGDRVFRALKGRFPCTHITLERNPKADSKTIEYLRTQTLSADCLIAVGSGTINDLCKYTAHLDRKPYIIFPTAASMNGYLSANASITTNGHKKTMLALMPQAVFCDMDVIANAPLRLNKSGLGDSLARPTSQADWLVSHLLLDTHYDETPFKLLAPLEPELFDQARGIALADRPAIELLMKTLLLSGLGMTIAGGSYPASQGEHMIAHLMDMMKGASWDKKDIKKKEIPLLHGEAIAVTTLTMAHMQENLLRATPIIRPDNFSSEKMISLLGSDVAMQARKAFDGKHALITHTIPDLRPQGWEDIAAKILPVSISPTKIKTILKAAEIAHDPHNIGWYDKEYDSAVDFARYTRERFTFLDLV